MEIIKISEPKVLESKNGYYVGRTCLTAHEFPDCNMTSYWDEYDRETEYFQTKEHAERALNYLSYSSYNKTE